MLSRFRLSSSYKTNPSGQLSDWICKVLQDFLVSFLFSFVFLCSLYCAFPQISQSIGLLSLFGYTFLFTLGWNLLLSNTLAILLSFPVLFTAGAIILLTVLTNTSASNRVGDYLRWLTSFFFGSDNPSDRYSHLTVLLLTVLCCFLVSVLVSRVSGNGIILVLALTTAILFDCTGSTFPGGLCLLFLFVFFFHYIRMRYSVYLDHRLSHTDSPSYGKRLPSLTVPACILVIITVTAAGLLPGGLLLSSRVIRKTGTALTSFLSKSEQDFFKSRDDVAYDLLPVGYDDGMGPLFDQSNVTTLKITSYLDTADYIYLRSHTSRSYQNGWIPGQLTPIEATDPVSPFTMGQNELLLSQKLLRCRAARSGNESCIEADLLGLIQTADISITYGSIKTSWVFELPMATAYSAFEGLSVQVADDIRGSGLFSSQTLPTGSNYTVTYLSPVKNNATVSLYRYFGDNYYNSLSPDERNDIYGDSLESYLLRTETVRSLFADTKGLPDPILSLGRKLTENSATSIDKALDIADYLLSDFVYDASCTLSGGDGDYVSDFLFTSRTGGEAHFASAAVLLLRAAGIPARYCEGYLSLAGGDLGEVEVRQKDAHAWAELYLEGLGWIPLEVTPTRGSASSDLRLPTYHAPDHSPSVLSTLSREDLVNGVLHFFILLGNGLLHICLLVLVLLLVFLVLSFLHRLVLRFSCGLWGARSVISYLCRFFRAAGYPRGKNEGLLTYTQRLDAMLPGKLNLSSSVASLYAHIYGGEALDSSVLMQLKSRIFLFPSDIKALQLPLRRRILLFFIF